MLFSYSMNFPKYKEFEIDRDKQREREGEWERQKINEFFSRVDFFFLLLFCQFVLFFPLLLWMRLYYWVARTMWRVELRKMKTDFARKRCPVIVSRRIESNIYGFLALLFAVSLCRVWLALHTEFHYTWRRRRRWRRMFSCIFKTVSCELLYFAVHFICRFVSLDLSACVCVWERFLFFFQFLVKAAIVSAHTPFVYLTFDFLYVFSHQNNIM